MLAREFVLSLRSGSQISKGDDESTLMISRDVKARAIRVSVVAFIVLDGILAIWPGLLPFNRIYPLIFGLPFVMAWLTLLIMLVGLALFILALFDRRAGGPSS